MAESRIYRRLRQHVRTDQLLGLDAVPSDRRAPSAEGVAPEENQIPLTQISNDPSRFAANESGVSPPLERSTKLQILQMMDHDEVQSCTKCELCKSRTRTVFGEGDPAAQLMFIGEGPGQSEDEQGRPFVGRAGELLNKMMEAMGFAREHVYIANVVKCRPPQNRTPTPGETATCWDYLYRQITTIRPRIIVTLGGPATKMLLQTKTGITALRGTWSTFTPLTPECPAIPVMPTFHPAYLLRSYTAENRRRVWSDLQQVLERLQSA